MWATLSFILTVGVGLSLWAGTQAKTGAIREATSQVRLVAQTELAPMLQPRDLEAPIVGERASELASSIERSITSAGPVQEVRIYSSVGRILYAEDPGIVGTRPSYIRDITSDVAATGHARSQVRGESLQTLVPIWLTPGGTVGVAELSQPYGPIASARSGEWQRLALITAGLLLASLAMVVVSTRAPARMPAPNRSPQPSPARGAARDHGVAGSDRPLYLQEGFRTIEEQRREAERRAEAAEQNLRGIQKQLQDALAKVKDLEGRLAVNDAKDTTNDSELRSLRDQLSETSERLNKAELENAALRERMALRQKEFDAAQRQTAAARTSGPDAEELQARLEQAERRAAEMSREMERLEAELDKTKSSFHMTKLSEALRELDTADDDGETDSDARSDDRGETKPDPPVVLRDRRGRTTPEKVR